MISIKISGLDELQKQIKFDVNGVVKVAAVGIATELQSILAEYPPATSANRPGRWAKTEYGDKPMGYYERNRGWWYPIMSQRTLFNRGTPGKTKNGTIRAPMRQRNTVAGYRLIGKSEQLGKKWFVRRTSNGAQLVNSASYAPSVQSDSDQARKMREIGWKTDKQAAIELVNSGQVQKIITDALATKLKGVVK